MALRKKKEAATLNLAIAGLYTHPDTLSQVPPGALSIADNIVIDREGIASTRRGLATYGDGLTITTGAMGRLFNYQDTLLVHYDDDTLAYDSDGAGTWTDYSGSYTAPSGFAIRSFSFNSNFYFSTDEGIYKLDSVTGTPTAAGGLKALNMVAAATGSTGFLVDGNNVAYRHVWAHRDANDVLVQGTVSERVVGSASGNDQDVALTITLPAEVTTDHLLQVYRSAQTTGTPSEELQLVYEVNPTTAEVSAKEISFTDNLSDGLRGATIYTAQSQQGIAANNEPPPLARDMCEFRQYAFYAYTSTKHFLEIQLLAVGGIANDDTVTVAGVTYTGKATEDSSSDEFLVETGGTPSFNIDETARSLVRVINESSSTTAVYAYYLSGTEDVPGLIRIEERGVGGSSFSVSCSKADVFLPELSGGESSSNETRKNRVYVSKNGQPESVPLLSYVDVGSRDHAIRRIIPLREVVFVLKDDGIYYISGTDTNSFSVTTFDNTTKIIAPETAVQFQNRIYTMSSQGVVAIGTTDIEVISRPIERTLIELKEVSAFGTSHAVAYESDRKYILYVPTSTSSDPAQAYVYNSITKSWTRWDYGCRGGIVNSADDNLYVTDNTLEAVRKERKSFSLSDFADEQYAVTISSSSGADITLSDASDATVGQTIKQSGLESVITSIDGNVVTVSNADYEWDADAATLYDYIPVVARWVEEDAGDPMLLKHWAEFSLLFDQALFDTAYAYVYTDYSNVSPEIPITPQVLAGAWGQFSWGQLPWGGGTGGGKQTVRQYFPRVAARAHWIILEVKLNQAFTTFSLSGVRMVLHGLGTKD